MFCVVIIRSVKLFTRQALFVIYNAMVSCVACCLDRLSFKAPLHCACRHFSKLTVLNLTLKLTELRQTGQIFRMCWWISRFRSLTRASKRTLWCETSRLVGIKQMRACLPMHFTVNTHAGQDLASSPPLRLPGVSCASVFRFVYVNHCCFIEVSVSIGESQASTPIWDTETASQFPPK